MTELVKDLLWMLCGGRQNDSCLNMSRYMAGTTSVSMVEASSPQIISEARGNHRVTRQTHGKGLEQGAVAGGTDL